MIPDAQKELIETAEIYTPGSEKSMEGGETRNVDINKPQPTTNTDRPEVEPEHDNPSTPQVDTPPMMTPEAEEEEPEFDMNNEDIADVDNVDYDIPTDAGVFREAGQQPTRHIIGGEDLVNFMYNDFIPAMEKIYKFREELEQQVIPGLEEVSSTE